MRQKNVSGKNVVEIILKDVVSHLISPKVIYDATKTGLKSR